MSDLRLPIEATQPSTLVTEPQPPVLVTEQEVMFGTAAAVRPRSTPMTRRMIDALRAVAAGWRSSPARPRYSRSAWYLEGARMSREMDRL